MPLVKDPFKRMGVIDRLLNDNRRRPPGKDDLRREVSVRVYDDPYAVSDSTIEKDLYSMRTEYGAPIKFDSTHGGYVYTESYHFSDAFIRHWSDHVDFSKSVNPKWAYQKYLVLQSIHTRLANCENMSQVRVLLFQLEAEIQ